ncbi:hypothetical protein K376_03078 [Streptomyces sp. PsTaAH-130]|nr:hypothetical protein K376_03078 [Streptomyces sp. PsTaAH-130]
MGTSSAPRTSLASVRPDALDLTDPRPRRAPCGSRAGGFVRRVGPEPGRTAGSLRHAARR